MRTVRHPITTFIIGVLAVIGIGVGIVAVTQNSNVYGPPWGRFTAAFTVAPKGTITPERTQQLGGGGSLTTGGSAYYVSPPRNWTFGELHISVDVLPYEDKSLGLDRSEWRNLTGSSGGTVSSTDLPGYSVLTLPPSCDVRGVGTRLGCAAEQIVIGRGVTWEIGVYGQPTPEGAEQFLASFQPIGSMGAFPSASTESMTATTGKTIAATQFRPVLGSASSCKTVSVNPPASSPAVLRQVPNSPALRPSSPCVRLAPAQFAVSRVASAQVVAFPLTKGDWEVNVYLTGPESVAFSRMFTADYHKEIAIVIFGEVQNVETPQYKGTIDNFVILVASRKLAERIIDGTP